MASADVCQGACFGALSHATGSSTGADPAAASLNPICPAVGLGTVGSGQATELQGSVSDGGIQFGGGHGGSFRLVVL